MTNEQRAHDVVIAMMQAAWQREDKLQLNSTVAFEASAQYESLYKIVLDGFKEKFPQA